MRALVVVAAMAVSACFTPVPEECHTAKCRFDAGTACSVGATQVCGTDVGECKQGRQLCQPNGTWGRCDGAVMPATEECDGLDNDCNGVVDDAAPMACTLTKGVCTGATASCGLSDACVAAYGAHYEEVEHSCDGLDNDCDGNIDRSIAVNVSQSPGVVSRNATAARVPGTGSAIVLYEEGQKISARVVAANGTLSPVVAPSVTVDAVLKAWAPAVATGETLVVAAWAEDTGSAKRVMVASLDGTTGKSTLQGGGALFALSVTSPTEVAVAIDEAAGRLVLAVIDNGAISVIGFSSTLPPPTGSPSFADTPYVLDAEHPSLSGMGGGEFLLTLDRPSSGKVMRTVIDTAGMGPVENSQPQGIDAYAFLADAGVASTFFLSSGEILASSCALSASAIACSVPGNALTVTGATTFRLSPPDYAAWGTSTKVFASRLIQEPLGGALSDGHNPWPVLMSTGALVFFDNADDVFFIRTCP